MPKWTVLKTSQGKILNNQVISGTADSPLRITRIVASRKGGMSTSQLLSATKETLLSSDRYAQDLQIVDVLGTNQVPPFTEEQAVIVGQLRNDRSDSYMSGTTTWDLCQIGVFAKASDGNEVLFLIAQDSEPDTIPIKSDNIIISNYSFNLLSSEDLQIESTLLNAGGLVTAEVFSALKNRVLAVEEDYLSKTVGGSVLGSVDLCENLTTQNISGKLLANGVYPIISGFSEIDSEVFKENGVKLEDKYYYIKRITTSVDFNDYHGEGYNGIYEICATPTNLPNVAGLGILFVHYHSSTQRTVQIYYPGKYNYPFLRYYNDDTWSTWKRQCDGGNAAAVGGKLVSDLFIKTGQYIRIEETDFNTVTTMGAYTIGTDNGSLMTESKNQPVGAYQWGTLAVFASGSYGLTQVYYTHTGDTYTRGLYGDVNWNSWKKCGENADTLDGKHATDFYPQGTKNGDSTITLQSCYNQINAGEFSDIDITYGMVISKESDNDGDSSDCPSILVSELGDAASFNMRYTDGEFSTNFNTHRRTLSVGASATIVIAASDTYPESAKFSADYICTGTDDSFEIQIAINQLTKGGKIILLNGTYNITTPVEIKYDNISIEGVGNSTILLQQNSVGLFKTTKTIYGLTLKNFKINGVQYLDNLIYISSYLYDCNIEGILYHYNSDTESDFAFVGRSDAKYYLGNSIITNCNLTPSGSVLVYMSNSIFTSNVVNGGIVNLYGSYNIITSNKAPIENISSTNTGNVIANNG